MPSTLYSEEPIAVSVKTPTTSTRSAWNAQTYYRQDCAASCRIELT